SCFRRQNMNQQQALYQRENSTLNTTVVLIIREGSRNQKNKEGSSFREFTLLGGRLLFKIAVKAPRGNLTTLICVRKGRDCCLRNESNDEEVNGAASHRETLYLAPKKQN
ncbi:hypothetical protein M9458_053831, partial [Cirrhinus mrigala]